MSTIGENGDSRAWLVRVLAGEAKHSADYSHLSDIGGELALAALAQKQQEWQALADNT